MFTPLSVSGSKSLRAQQEEISAPVKTTRPWVCTEWASTPKTNQYQPTKHLLSRGSYPCIHQAKNKLSRSPVNGVRTLCRRGSSTARSRSRALENVCGSRAIAGVKERQFPRERFSQVQLASPSKAREALVPLSRPDLSLTLGSSALVNCLAKE